MALPQISSLNDFLSGALEAGTNLYNLGVENILNPIEGISENFNPSRPSISNNFTYDVFPQDVSSESFAHYMTITAITGGIPSGAAQQLLDAAGRAVGAISQDASLAANQSQYAAVIFIPGGSSGSGIVNHDVHEYADIKLTNLLKDQVGVGATLSGISGYSMNPGVQVLYRSTSLRSFQFQFLMAPQSERESRSMESIIQNLRYWAAPRAVGVLFQSPAEFQVRYYSQNRENPHIPKMRRCVLNRIDVDYAPLSGEWSTFSNGHPVAALLSLNFQEMEIIHKDLIVGGH